MFPNNTQKHRSHLRVIFSAAAAVTSVITTFNIGTVYAIHTTNQNKGTVSQQVLENGAPKQARKFRTPKKNDEKIRTQSTDFSFAELNDESNSGCCSMINYLIQLQQRFWCGCCCNSASESQNQKVKFKVLAFNIWMVSDRMRDLAGDPLISPFKKSRAQALAYFIGAELKDVDVLVFSEAFCDNTMSMMSTLLKEYGFKYETFPQYYKIENACSSTNEEDINQESCFENSGIKFYSKHPILSQTWTFFPITARAIYMSIFSKGAEMIKVEKNGLIFNVVGTHLESFGDNGKEWGFVNLHKENRMDQIRQIKRELVNKSNENGKSAIGTNEVIIYAGDMNVNKFKYDNAHELNVGPGSEYFSMIRIFNATDFAAEERTSTHGIENGWLNPKQGCASENTGTAFDKYLDYVLVDREHKRPAKGTVRTLTDFPSNASKKKLKRDLKHLVHYPFYAKCAAGKDKGFIESLSDHEPVLGEFEFVKP